MMSKLSTKPPLNERIMFLDYEFGISSTARDPARRDFTPLGTTAACNPGVMVTNSAIEYTTDNKSDAGLDGGMRAGREAGGWGRERWERAASGGKSLQNLR
jgi:hypothetical protein